MADEQVQFPSHFDIGSRHAVLASCAGYQAYHEGNDLIAAGKPAAVLAGLPAVWYGGIHCNPNATAELRRVLYEHYPTVTVIDVAATLETVRQVLLQITYVIQFLAAFSIFAGIVILASSDCGDALSPHPRSGRAQDAWRHTRPRIARQSFRSSLPFSASSQASRSA